MTNTLEKNRSKRAPREDEDEGAAETIAEQVQGAIATGDVRRLVGLLEEDVVLAEGEPRGADGAHALTSLEAAGAGTGYRDRAARPLGRVLTSVQIRDLFLDLLERADEGSRTGIARELPRLIPTHWENRSGVMEGLRTAILGHRPHLLDALEAMAPGAARLDGREIRDLAHDVSSGDPDRTRLWALAPRLALGLPKLSKRERDDLAVAVALLAESDSAHAPGAIDALAAARVSIEREVRWLRPIEAAARAGVVQNVRALERLGARAPRRDPPRVQAPEPGRTAKTKRGKSKPGARGARSRTMATRRWRVRSQQKLTAVAASLLATTVLTFVAPGSSIVFVPLLIAFAHALLGAGSVFHGVAGHDALTTLPARAAFVPLLGAASVACVLLGDHVDALVRVPATAILLVGTLLAMRRRPEGPDPGQG